MALNIPSPTETGNGLLQGLNTGSELMLRRAQTMREQKLADLPFGGANVPGPAGQVVGLEMIRQLYGENSSQYKQAAQAFTLNQQSIGSRINYQNTLAGTVPLRYTTNQGRQIIEQSNVAQGYAPTGAPVGTPVAPGQPNYLPPSQVPNQTPESLHYGLRQTKQDLPTFVMQKNLYANNIDKTLDNIDLNILTQYNGPKGAFELKIEQGLDAVGKASPKYQAYKEAEAKFNFLGNQIRQFYGDSIQPTAMERLQQKLDPRGFLKSNKTGKASFNSTKDLLKKELQTYRDASSNPSVYQGQNPSSQGNPPTNPINPQPEQTNTPTTEAEVEIYNPQGKLVARGSKDAAAEFLKEHRGHYQKVINK